jgi:hypothetical protein
MRTRRDRTHQNREKKDLDHHVGEPLVPALPDFNLLPAKIVPTGAPKPQDRDNTST